jgi:uncharacterized protein (TIGR00725 family)
MQSCYPPKIAVSGAAGGGASIAGEQLAYQVGRQIALQGGVTLTGATGGVPYAAARGAKIAHGQVLGFSPANSFAEHTRSYRLPTRYHDTIFFTGQNYAGRDILLVDFSDIVIEISGRIGTLHEFTHAFERGKIIGVLLGSGGTIHHIPEILAEGHRGMGKVIMESDPELLVKKLMAKFRSGLIAQGVHC